ncbi:MAG: DUF507 family protein [Nitrospirae bacterium]|nr:DUF507 family protein [Nitrospirota bacterium]MBF0542569.1 DUF507 family protein [Nitrospirota bacterium]
MLSDDKISHLSHILLRRLTEEKLIKAEVNEAQIRKEIKKIINDHQKVGFEIEGLVKKKIRSLSRNVVEGTQEWDVLYKKYSEEEEQKKGLV